VRGKLSTVTLLWFPLPSRARRADPAAGLAAHPPGETTSIGRGTALSSDNRPRVRTLVLGLGNPLLGDDAVGLKVAALVRERLAGTPGVDVGEEEAGGLRLMERLAGYDRAVLVDAAVTGAEPGEIRRLTPGDPPTQRTAAAHGIDLPRALALGRQLGHAMPSEVRIVAIEVASVREFRHDMTPAVDAAVLPAVAAVLEELEGAPPPAGR
jgi:hydrogenase maturation protease